MKVSAINRFFGAEEEDGAGGLSRLRLRVRDEFRQETGVTHGGIATYLLDGAMGRTVMRTIAPSESAATVQLSVQFLRPAEGVIVAEAKILKRGKRAIFMEGECRNEKGELVAKAQGTWAVFPTPNPEAGGSGAAR